MEMQISFRSLSFDCLFGIENFLEYLYCWSYLKEMTFYQLGNIDSRITNPDQRLTADI